MPLVAGGERQLCSGRWLAGALVAMVLAAGIVTPAAAQEPSSPTPPGLPAKPGIVPRLVREGTLSLSGQAQYGTLFARTGFGRDYNAGPGMVITARYRTSRESAIGLSFGAQRVDVDKASPVAAEARWIRGITTTFDYYQYFGVRGRAPKYVVAGAGLIQMRRRLVDGETDFPGDSGVLNLGVGTEVWWKRWVAVDVSARYYGFLHKENGVVSLTHGVQAAAGFDFYTSR
jgi:hypothetical protein